MLIFFEALYNRRCSDVISPFPLNHWPLNSIEFVRRSPNARVALFIHSKIAFLSSPDTCAVRPVLPDLPTTLSQTMVARNVCRQNCYSFRFACWEWRWEWKWRSAKFLSWNFSTHRKFQEIWSNKTMHFPLFLDPSFSSYNNREQSKTLNTRFALEK